MKKQVKDTMWEENTVREVLEWSDKHVESVIRTTYECQGQWSAYIGSASFTAPMIYQSLYKAWKSAHPTNKDVM